MEQNKQRYKIIFRGFLVSVLLVFFYMRPLHSPWHPFIAGDGLGYYSYLPALFIYHDTDFEFKWFNKAHDQNYVYSTFKNPEDNLLVKYGNRRINKYYQGLSFIWMPFFVLGHLLAKLSGVPADGYSWPYQWAIGLASVVFLFAGLIYLRKLILALTSDERAATLVPVAVFYGTHLFTYAISANSLSHAYSFTFLTAFLFQVLAFWRAKPAERSFRFFAALFLLVIAAAIRPLTVLTVLVLPAFFPKGFWSEIKKTRPGFGWREIALLTLTMVALGYTLFITRQQTGSFLAYTYTNETFDFRHARFFDALFSYHMGLFVYVPLVPLAFVGVFYLPRLQRLLLPLFFFAMLWLYSAWWYWPIVKRALIDFYAIPAMLLGAGFAGLSQKTAWRRLYLVGITLACFYFQLKSMQFRRGILDENATYAEVFWRNFFRTSKANMYLIPPYTILKQASVQENFEAWTNKAVLSDVSHEGNYSLRLDSAHYISRVVAMSYPDWFSHKGFRKLRFSCYGLFRPGIKSVHVFIRLLDREEKVLQEVPFYLNEEDLPHDAWDYKEFGYELPAKPEFDESRVHTVDAVIWNVEGRHEVLIDGARIECVLTDRSFETI